VYKAVAAKDGGFEWQFDEPLAHLSDGEGKRAGLHYRGPAWEAADGSKVVKKKEKDPKSADAPNKETDVPWLLISVKAEDAKDGKLGTLSKVVYVQRVATSGGVKPKEPPKHADSRIGVPYTATYYFWAAE